MLDRKTAPRVITGEKIHFVAPQVHQITKDLNLYYMDKVPDETVRLELHFNAGQIFGKKNMSNFVSALLLSGTKDKKSEQIHEELDFLGAYVDHEISMEKAFVNLYCLSKNVYKALAILIDAIQNCNFDAHEIENMLQEKKQRFLVSNEKVGFLARKEFQSTIFGKNEAYSRQITLSEFDNISRQDLIDFHKEFYLQGLNLVVVVANLGEEMLSYVKTNLSSWSNKQSENYALEFHNEKGLKTVEKSDAMQTAIRLGLPLFNKKHPDYCKFLILQTILGDYFGSRLMSNIREDKGYTYGIGCALVELKEAAYFVIATEVKQEVTKDTLNEIQKEIQILKNELVSEDELNLVKNYLRGQLLKSADGPNAMMDLFIGVQQHQFDLEFYNVYSQAISDVTAQDLKEVANKYLIWENFSIICAGKYN